MDTVFVIGGALNDTLMLDPGPIAGNGDRIYMFDYGDRAIKAFRTDGSLLWTFGRSGQGPGEFVNVTDVEVATNGDVWLTDSRTSRITVLSPDGSLQRTIPFHVPVGRLALTLSSIIGILEGAEDFWVELDTLGTVLSRGDFANTTIAAAHPFYRQALVATDLERQSWAAVHVFADGIAIFDGTVRRCTGTLVRGTPPSPVYDLPRGQAPSIWAASAALTQEALVVLARDVGAPEDQRVLDRYSSITCSYTDSIRLPERVRGILFLGNGLWAFVIAEPIPRIIGVRLTATGSN